MIEEDEKIIKKMSKIIIKNKNIKEIENLKEHGIAIANSIQETETREIIGLTIIISFDSAIEGIKKGNFDKAKKDLEMGIRAILVARALVILKYYYDIDI